MAEVQWTKCTLLHAKNLFIYDGAIVGTRLICSFSMGPVHFTCTLARADHDRVPTSPELATAATIHRFKNSTPTSIIPLTGTG